MLIGSGDNPLTYFQPGTYSLDNGNGGPDVPGFQASTAISQGLTWSNAAALVSAPRSSDMTLMWTGGGAADQVWVFVYGVRQDGSGAVVGCAERGDKGQFTIPASMLAQMPATDNNNSFGIIGFYSTSVANRFQPSAGLDAGYVLSLGYSMQTVKLQ